jgi:8-amino-7-oxononanoate synthase
MAIPQKSNRTLCNMKNVDQYLAKKIEQRKQEGNLRQLTTYKARVDLFSNDYLGLATSGMLNITEDTGSSGTGSTGSRLLSGNSPEAEALESKIAAFHGADAALLFNSGYDANMGLLSSVASRQTTIVYDELCHASIIDGIRLSVCSNKFKFCHNDLQDLENKLKRYSTGEPVLVAQIVQLCGQYDAQLIVDEAHATGVFGHRGQGLVCAMNLQDRVFARVHTFGKALGCHGAAVLGSGLLRDYLVNFARSFIYTTALPGHTIKTIHKAYDHLSSDDFTNHHLHGLIAYFRGLIATTAASGWKDSHSPIQALIIGDNGKAKNIAANLQDAGLQVKPILSPTVPAGMERLRVCLHTFNTKEQIDLLFQITTNG